MPVKLATPLFILILSYILIIGLCLIALILVGAVAYDLRCYFKNRADILAKKACERYLEEDYEAYIKCYHQTLGHFQQQKNTETLEH